MAFASAVVRAKRDGRSARRGFRLVEKNTLYRCLDKLLEHKAALFTHLRQRWKDLFGARFEVLLYDLTSTYFESDPPDRRKRQAPATATAATSVRIACRWSSRWWSRRTAFRWPMKCWPATPPTRRRCAPSSRRSKRNTARRERIWVMDRGIPTEDVLAEMRRADPPVAYLVGTPEGTARQTGEVCLGLPWQEVRQGVEVKLLGRGRRNSTCWPRAGRASTRSGPCVSAAETGCGRGCKQLAQMNLTRETLLDEAGRRRSQGAGGLAPARHQGRSRKPPAFSLLRSIARSYAKCGDAKAATCCAPTWRPRSGRTCGEFYIQLTEVEAAFKNLKDDLQLRPIYHQLEQPHRGAHLRGLPGLLPARDAARPAAADGRPASRPRAVLDKLAAMQDARCPLPDNRRPHADHEPHTEPNIDQKLLMQQLGLVLPLQPPPRIAVLVLVVHILLCFM